MSCPCLFLLGRSAVPEAAALPPLEGGVVAEDPFPSVDLVALAFPFPFAAGVLSPPVFEAFLDTMDESSSDFRLGGILMSAIRLEAQCKGALPRAVEVIAERSTSARLSI